MSIKRKIGWLSISPLFVVAADKQAINLLDLSLSELLNIKVTTASVIPSRSQTQPATLSIFHAEDIHQLGARNLMEILERVPGIAFGVDVFGVTSLVFRGHWAHEGKVLLMIDDMPVNDILYGTLNLGEHYPASLIERVEILRGAGTAKYGGNAQLAVIKVFTKRINTSNSFVNVGLTFNKGTQLGKQLNLHTGINQADFDWSISGHVNQTGWSGKEWIDTAGQSWDLDQYSEVDAYSVNSMLNWQGFSANYFYDYHNVETPHRFGFGIDGEEIEFSSLNLKLQYEWKMNDAMTFIPSYFHRKQQDWFIDRDPVLIPPPPLDFFLEGEKDSYHLDFIYAGKELSLQSGLQYWREQATALSPGGSAPSASVYFDGSPSVSYHATSAYVQADLQFFNLQTSLGARYSNHSYSGSSLVPRISVVYNQDNWHLKAHVGQAFREPGPEVINGAVDMSIIKPEKTFQKEVELGWQPQENWFGTLSIYEMDIQDPIFYSSIGENSYEYSNQERVRTQGLDFEMRAFLDTRTWHVSYSFYRSPQQPVEVYRVPLVDDAHLGAPKHKLSISWRKKMAIDGLSVAPSLVWMRDIYAYDYDASQIDSVGNNLSVRRYSNWVIGNILANYEMGQWEVVAGVYDIFDKGRLYPQPFHSESTPYIGQGRQISFTLKYEFDD